MNAFFMAVDEKYLPIAEVTAKCLLKKYNADVHIFLESNKPEDIEGPKVKHDNLFYHINALSPITPKHFPESSRWPKVVFARLFAPNFLKSYDRVVYLDTDILPILERPDIWSQPLEGGVGGVIDFGLRNTAPWHAKKEQSSPPNQNRIRESWLKSIGIETTKYFNSGVLIIDTDIWNSIDLKSIASHFFQRYRAHMFDQDFLNYAFQGRWTEFGPEYNFQESMMDFGLASIIEPAFLHFNSKLKPWQANKRWLVKDVKMISREFYNDALKRIGYDRRILFKETRPNSIDIIKSGVQLGLSSANIQTSKERSARNHFLDEQQALKCWARKFNDNMSTDRYDNPSYCFNGRNFLIPCDEFLLYHINLTLSEVFC